VVEAGASVNPALVVLNPRRIPEAIDAFDALPILQARLQGFTERRIQDIWPDLLRQASERGVTHLCVVSDDVIVTQRALTAVLQHHDLGVVTGWCNLDEVRNEVNLSDKPLTNRIPHEDAYTMPTVWEVLEGPSLRPSWFTGMCLTTAPLSVWTDFPFRVYGAGAGCASDYNMSLRLQDAGIPITAIREGFVRHLKAKWNTADRTDGRELVFDGERVVWLD
jgi:hypothetical protein